MGILVYKDTYYTWQCRRRFRDNLLDISMTTKKENAIARNPFGIKFAKLLSGFSLDTLVFFAQRLLKIAIVNVSLLWFLLFAFVG